MFKWSFIFFCIGLVSCIFAYTSIAPDVAAVAEKIFSVSLALMIVMLLFGHRIFIVHVFNSKTPKMLAEVNEAQQFLINKFGSANAVPAGRYAVPFNTSRGSAFMAVNISAEGFMSDFNLFWDEALTISWYQFEKDGTTIKS